jgi:hypothetical protein
MRTVVAILIGLAVLGVWYAVARRRGPRAVSTSLAAFGIVWFIACVVDAFVGVWSGYPWVEELLIHLVIWAVPVAAAAVLARVGRPQAPAP